VPTRYFGSPGVGSNGDYRLEKKQGTADHRLIDLTIEMKWLRERIGPTSSSDWIKEYVDPHDDAAPSFSASKLRVANIPLQGRPDVVLRHKFDGTVLIIERKTTRRHPQDIPTEGWPNVEAQLWCYSWIDEYVDATEVLMFGQLWQDRKMLNVHFLWKRSDQHHDACCRTWFERYGGTVE